MSQLKTEGLIVLNREQSCLISGGAEAAKGSYAMGYKVGSWFREMYNIWSYGLTHLNER